MGAETGTRNFDDIGRIPAPGDNVAIATRRLEAGTVVVHEGRSWPLTHTVLEGHRFVLEPIAAGAPLLSWGLPFGRATRDLSPGEYVCNEKILKVLAERSIDFALPAEANFRDHMETYAFDPGTFKPGAQVAQGGLDKRAFVTRRTVFAVHHHARVVVVSDGHSFAHVVG